MAANVRYRRYTTIVGVKSGEGDASRDDQFDEEVDDLFCECGALGHQDLEVYFPLERDGSIELPAK